MAAVPFDVSCALPSTARPVQAEFTEASQKTTVPRVTGAPEFVAVAVRVTGVPEGTEVTALPELVSARVKAEGVCPAFATPSRTTFVAGKSPESPE